jgi:hypothetical protein
MKKWINNFYGGLEKNISKVLLTTEVDISESELLKDSWNNRYRTFIKNYGMIIVHDSKRDSDTALLGQIDRTMQKIERKQAAMFKYYLYLIELKSKIRNNETL